MSSYCCSNCDYVSNTKWNVKNHINRVCKGAELKENIVKVKCDICDKEFETDKLLAQHKQRCFEKKTAVVVEYLDPEKIEEMMSNMMTLIKSLQNDNGNLSNEVRELWKSKKELEKRVEILEKNNSIEKQCKKKGYEILDPDDPEMPVCSSVSMKKLFPKKYTDILEELDHINYESGFLSASLQVSVRVGENTEYAKATENGVYLLAGGEKFEYGKVEIITKKTRCERDSGFKVIKTERCYCSKHFDEETGKPLVEE